MTLLSQGSSPTARSWARSSPRTQLAATFGSARAATASKYAPSGMLSESTSASS